ALDTACLITAAPFLVANPRGAESQGGAVGVAQMVFLALTAEAFSVVGALIAVRRPENRVGAICLAIGTVWALSFAVGSVGLWALETGRLGAAAVWIAAIGPAWVPALGLMATHLPLRLPDGRLPSPRWRWFSRFCTGGIVFATVAILTDPGVEVDGHPNPAASEALQPFGPLLLMLLLVGFVGAILSVVRRWRRSAGRER